MSTVAVSKNHSWGHISPSTLGSRDSMHTQYLHLNGPL